MQFRGNGEEVFSFARSGSALTLNFFMVIQNAIVNYFIEMKVNIIYFIYIRIETRNFFIINKVIYIEGKNI